MLRRPTTLPGPAVIRFGRMLALVAVLAVATTGCGSSTSETDAALVDGSIGKAELKVQPKWKEVLRVRNIENHKTKRFEISGSEWKIKWRTKPGRNSTGDEDFIIILYDKNNQDVSEIIANVTGEDEDFTFLEGKGEYYLDIKTSQPYEVVVEQIK